MKFSEMIESFYDAEVDMEHQDTMLVKFSIQASVQDVAMLNAICERFGTSRYAIGKDMVANAVTEMFSALTPDDSTALAAKADAEITEHMKKNGYTEFFEYGAAGTFNNECGHWRNNAALKNGLKAVKK